MTWSDRVAVVGVALAVLAGPAAAQGQQFDIEVMVVQLGQGAGGLKTAAFTLFQPVMGHDCTFFGKTFDVLGLFFKKA